MTKRMTKEGTMSEGEDKEPSGGRGARAPLAANQTISHAPITLQPRRAERRSWRSTAARSPTASGATTPSTNGASEAVFSIFRRTSEVPLYRIVKQPRLARRQGAYAVLAAGGLILKRGHDLGKVLCAIDRGLRLVKA